MGPRPISRGEWESDKEWGAMGVASMGPRPISRGECLDAAEDAKERTASMGPRPISRGEEENRKFWEVTPAGFNGAAADQPRRGCEPFRCELFRCASMGPRPISRGEAAGPRALNDAGRLQWGRGRSAAERTRSGTSRTS